MRHKWKSLLALLFAALVLVGCGQDSTDNAENNQEDKENTEQMEKQEVVTVVISKDNGAEVVTEKEIPIEEGTTVLGVMKENFEIEESDGFITSIEGVSQDDKNGKYWMYTVNEEMAKVGAAEYKLEPGDQVTFDLHAME
ncbi:DUF4430 domain-containing protein [Radiobacillus kanasensis]|uniref:DUF4430 domain-containing protein n=1 Tax=Radiobacillus kanasensis TaxID=2844358 RepID=UPI001E2C70B7|nr:DUF4430 domain-containing protein [Radiobacillus kanasensis]UFT97663.1 DUF4430 domain-containing protein [Radiobacillus kanasensis]